MQIKEKLETVFKEHSYFDDILILRPDLIKEHLPFIKEHGKRLLLISGIAFQEFRKGKKQYNTLISSSVLNQKM